VQALATDAFGGWTGGETHRALVRPYRATAPVTRTIETPDKANAVLTAGALFDVGDENTDYPALLLANYMLGGHSKSRLYERIRAQEGLSYAVQSQLAAVSDEPLVTWTFIALTNPVNMAKAEAAFRDEIQKAVASGFPAAEVEASKQGFLSTRQVQRSDDVTLTQRLAVLAYNGRTMQFDRSLEEKVAALTPSLVNEAVRRHLDPTRLVVIRAGDFSKAQ